MDQKISTQDKLVNIFPAIGLAILVLCGICINFM